jgi:hypothetical protein
MARNGKRNSTRSRTVATATSAKNTDSDINTRKVTLTLIRDRSGASMKAADLSLPEWCDHIRNSNGTSKESLEWLKGALFGNQKSERGSYRTNVNVRELTAVVVEYDGEKISFDKAIDTVKRAGLRALPYTSPSHRKRKPRWRIVFPLSCRVAPFYSRDAKGENKVDRHAELVAAVNGLFDGQLAEESFTLSQSYYFGSVDNNPDHRCEVIDGDFLDQRSDLDQGRLFKNGSSESSTTLRRKVRKVNGTPNVYQLYGAHPFPANIDEVRFALTKIDADSYLTWRDVGAGLSDEFDDDAKDLFHEWSATSSKYQEDFCNVKWDDFSAMTEIGVDRIFSLADEADKETGENWRTEWREYNKPPPDPDAPPKQPKFQLIAIDDVKPSDEPFYLVDEIATAGPSLGAFVGKAKSGKSFAAADMFFHVAMNKEFLGRKVNGGGAVVYVTNEGIRGFDLRMMAMRQHYGVEGKGVPFFVVHTMPDMGAKPNDAKELVKAIQNALPKNTKVAAVIVDTLARAMNGKSDSDPVDMGCFISNCGIISQELQCTSCPVHHSPRGEDGRPRGSNQFDGALDFMIVVVKDGTTGISTATVDMMKDGPEGMSWRFKIQPKELKSARFEDRAVGVAHGLENASRDQGGARSARSAHGIRLSPKQRRLFDVIIKATCDQGKRLPKSKHVPYDVIAITREQLKLALKNQGFFDKDMTENSIRRGLSEGLNALAGKQLIGLTEEHVWTTDIE